MGTIAMYAGSFDPPTNGHLDVIQRGATLFETVLVAVGHNPAKRYLFRRETRVDLLRQCVGSLTNVRVVTFEGLLVDACKHHGASVILRGLRSSADFDAESRYGLANRDLRGIETLFLLASPEHSFVSSSLVKEIATNGGDVSRYLSPNVHEALGRALGAS